MGKLPGQLQMCSAITLKMMGHNVWQSRRSDRKGSLLGEWGIFSFGHREAEGELLLLFSRHRIPSIIHYHMCYLI